MPEKTSSDSDPDNIRHYVRNAMYEIHGPLCARCRRCRELRDLTLDHVIPQYLANHPIEFQKHLHDMGLPPDYDVNAYYNLQLLCHFCNSQKSNRLYPPAVTLDMLRKAGKNAERVRKRVVKMRSAPRRARAILSLGDLLEHDQMSNADSDALQKAIGIIERLEIRVISIVRRRTENWVLFAGEVQHKLADLLMLSYRYSKSMEKNEYRA